MYTGESHNSYSLPEGQASATNMCSKSHDDFDLQIKVLCAIRAGQSPQDIINAFNISGHTYYEIDNDRKKIGLCLSKFDETDAQSGNPAKRMKFMAPLDERLEIATYKWYLQMKAKGANITPVDIHKAAETITEHLNREDYKSNNSSWVPKYHNEHSISPNRNYAESNYHLPVPDDCTTQVRNIMNENNISEFQLYCADESGLFWRAMPENVLEMLPCYDINRQKITALLCSNADGSHKFKPLVIGNLRDRRELRNTSENLPVVYKSSTSGVMTSSLFIEWFQNFFIPGVKHYQENVLGLDACEVKALLVLDNAGCHPDVEYLCSIDNRIKVIILSNSQLTNWQPMEQGIFYSCKLLYRKYLLDDCLVFSKATNPTGVLDLEASSNVRSYGIKDAFFNLARAWKEVTSALLKNAWNKLLQKEDVYDEQYEDLTPSMLLQLLHAAGNSRVSLQDVEEWLHCDELEPGHDDKAVMGIAPIVSWGNEETVTDEESSVNERTIGLNEAKTAMDHVIRFVNNPKFPNMHKYYGVAKELRSTITDTILNRTSTSQSMFDLTGESFANSRTCLRHRDSGCHFDADSESMEVTSTCRHDIVKEEDDFDLPEGRILSILTRIETKVDVLNYKVDNLERRLDALSSHAMPIDDDSYSWEELPVKTYEEFELLEAKLKQDNYYKLALERRLMLIGGDSLRSCVKRILEVLLSHEVQLLFNWAGTVGRKAKDQKPKLAFKNTELCPILTRVVVRTNEGTTEDLIHKEVMLYLRGCADRCGGRQRRLQLKMREESGQGSDGGGNEDNSQPGSSSSRSHQDGTSNPNSNAANVQVSAAAASAVTGGPAEAFRPNPAQGPGGPAQMPPHPFFSSDSFGNHHLLNLSSGPLNANMQIDH